MSPEKPEAPKGGAERPQEQRTATGADDKSKQQGTGPQGGYGPEAGYGPQGWGGQMPPPWWWGMQPGMGGPYGMYGGMPPGGPQGMGHHHHHHRPWDPYQPGPWAWFSWLMPWLGPWWSWLSSWFVWPGASWMMPPFGPFPPGPWYPGGPVGPGSEQTLRFAETRAAFWRHSFQAQADILRQAANTFYVPGVPPAPPAVHVDIAQLKEALREWPEPQAAVVIHAVQLLQAWDGLRPQQRERAGADW